MSALDGPRLSIAVSPDLEAYAAGTIGVEQVRCALCLNAPCGCPEFGSDEYFALLARSTLASSGDRPSRTAGATQ